MARRSNSHQTPVSSRDEAVRIARGTQQPGQTKEQTKLIARGIQKGIEQYRNQQSARSRELDKRLKKAKPQVIPPDTRETPVQEKVIYKYHRLPWVLLILTWLALVAYWFIYRVT
jgi:Protein of unknown function (DUF2956)